MELFKWVNNNFVYYTFQKYNAFSTKCSFCIAAD